MPASDEPATPPPEERVCELCGDRFAVGRLGAQCPRCLLSLASSFGLPGEDAPAEDLLDPLQVRHFGDYELLEEIARGGMGIVYRARQISLQREVAIKMILSGELAGKTALRMFQIEAHAAAHLHHPHIVPVYEIGEHQTQHYFTMRFVPGRRTIADWAQEHRGEYLALATAAAQVARAVAHAHTRSVLHRDLKPSNILWDAEAGPQVTDFGLARVLDEPDGQGTRPILAIGSPSYMAPEQMDGRVAEITTATDVYGLGAVLYEMLAGRPPFAGASALETMRRAAEEAPAPLPDVPRDLRTICLTCLAKDQEDRYASAALLAEDLECFARGEPVSVVPLTAPQILWRWTKRRPGSAVLTAVCILSVLAGVGGVLWQWHKAELARAEQARALAHLHWQEIDHWLNDGDAPRALAYLASLIREQPERWPAVMYALSIVDRFSFPVLAGPEIHPPSPLITEARLAPDGSWLAGAGEDRIVRVWETATGKETAQLPQATPITALAVAVGPIVLAVAKQNGGLTVHPALAAPPVALPRTASDSIHDLHFSTDGSRLLARTTERVEIWRMNALEQPPVAFSLDGGLKGASLSGDGTRVFAWNAREAVVWETDSGRELLRVAAGIQFRSGVMAAGGSRVALLDGESSARAWNVASGQSYPALGIPTVSLGHLAFDQAGDRLTLGGNSTDLTVFDIASGLPVSPPMRHHYMVKSLTACPDGGRTVSVGWDNIAEIWDARTGHSAMAGIPLRGTVRGNIGCDLSRDGRLILVHTGREDRAAESLSVWRATRPSEPRRQSVEGQFNLDAARLSPDARLGGLGLHPGNRCYVYDLATGRVFLDKAVEGSVYVQLFTPDAARCYALTSNGWLHGWSLETGQELWKPNHQPGFIRPAALSPDGTRIIAGHADGHIRIYDTATGELVQTLDHPGEIKVLRFAPDGSGRFVSGGSDRLAHVWDLRTGRMLQTFTGHADALISAAWSPDSRLIATASYDQTARVWDVATGRSVGAVMSHLAGLSHLEFSPDGAHLATACRDGTARLWHPLTGLPASPPLPQQSTSETVRFTADGAVFLVRNHDGFRFWSTNLAEPVTVAYPEPEAAGLGMDGESYRAIMSREGRQVFLGTGMNDAALWTIPQPRGRAPAWLPDFFETLAQVRLNERGEIQPVARTAASAIAAPIRQAAGSDDFAVWASQILDAPGR